MARCYLRSLLVNCDVKGCEHKASFIAYASNLVIDGRYCAPHAKDAIARLRGKEKTHA